MKNQNCTGLHGCGHYLWCYYVINRANTRSGSQFSDEVKAAGCDILISLGQKRAGGVQAAVTLGCVESVRSGLISVSVSRRAEGTSLRLLSVLRLNAARVVFSSAASHRVSAVHSCSWISPSDSENIRIKHFKLFVDHRRSEQRVHFSEIPSRILSICFSTVWEFILLNSTNGTLTESS